VAVNDLFSGSDRLVQSLFVIKEVMICHIHSRVEGIPSSMVSIGLALLTKIGLNQTKWSRLVTLFS
jgi:hypothetical protein